MLCVLCVFEFLVKATPGCVWVNEGLFDVVRTADPKHTIQEKVSRSEDCALKSEVITKCLLAIVWSCWRKVLGL